MEGGGGAPFGVSVKDLDLPLLVLCVRRFPPTTMSDAKEIEEMKQMREMRPILKEVPPAPPPLSTSSLKQYSSVRMGSGSAFSARPAVPLEGGNGKGQMQGTHGGGYGPVRRKGQMKGGGYREGYGPFSRMGGYKGNGRVFGDSHADRDGFEYSGSESSVGSQLESSGAPQPKSRAKASSSLRLSSSSSVGALKEPPALHGTWASRPLRTPIPRRCWFGCRTWDDVKEFCRSTGGIWTCPACKRPVSGEWEFWNHLKNYCSSEKRPSPEDLGRFNESYGEAPRCDIFGGTSGGPGSSALSSSSSSPPSAGQTSEDVLQDCLEKIVRELKKATGQSVCP